MWLLGSVAVVVAAAVAVLAAFLEPDPEAATPSRRGAVTPQELRRPRLPTAWRGYDRGHVDALLARAAATLEEAPTHRDREDAGTEDSPSDEPAPLPSFLRDVVGLDPSPESDDADASTGEEAEDRARSGEELDDRARSGEEFEDRGRDRTGGLDR